MKTRLIALGALLALLVPGWTRAQSRGLYTMRMGPMAHLTRPGSPFRVTPSNFGGFVSPYGAGPRTQARPLIRIGMPGTRFYQGRRFDLKQQVGSSLRAGVRTQSRSYAAAAIDRNRKRTEASLARSRTPRMHGLGANSSGFRYSPY